MNTMEKQKEFWPMLKFPPINLHSIYPSKEMLEVNRTCGALKRKYEETVNLLTQ